MPISPNTDPTGALRRIQCFLLDMDGTFYLGDRLIPGSLEFLAALRERGIHYMFLTNNSSKSAAHYVQKLQRMGLAPEHIHLYTSGQATCAFLLKEYPGKRVFLMGNASLRAEFQSQGVPLSDTQPDIVVAGYDTELTYEKLTDACLFLREGMPFIATHPDINCPSERGPLPDLGAMLRLIEASTGRAPDHIIGKPHAGIIEGALKIAGFNAGQSAMVGDRLYTDIEAGNRHGLLSILVLSGETTLEQAQSSDIQPKLVFEDLKSLIPRLR